jgi:hypothetical protein
VFKRNLARMVVGALIAAVPVLAAIPAEASPQARPAESGHLLYVGAPGHDTRCYSHQYEACLYAGPSILTKFAYWPANGTFLDLSNHYFWGGTGEGENTAVNNNAEAIYCAASVFKCDVHTGVNGDGNGDYVFGGDVGQLDVSKDAANSLVLN